MIDMLLPTAVLTSATLLMVVAVYSARVGVFAPRAEPAYAPGLADPSAITLAGSSELVQTRLDPRPTPAAWQTTTLRSLTDVEDLLDSLEAHGIATREVEAVAGGFAVRWK